MHAVLQLFFVQLNLYSVHSKGLKGYYSTNSAQLMPNEILDFRGMCFHYVFFPTLFYHVSKTEGYSLSKQFI